MFLYRVHAHFAHEKLYSNLCGMTAVGNISNDNLKPHLGIRWTFDRSIFKDGGGAILRTHI